MEAPLPDLPRKNNRKESKMDERVAKWFFKNHPQSVLLEVKMTGGTLLEHQDRLIKKVSKTGEFMYKFPDGGRRTPLDYVILKNADAVLAVCDPSGLCDCTINNIFTCTIKV